MDSQHREYGKGQTLNDLGCSRQYHIHIIHEDLFSYRRQTGDIISFSLNCVVFVLLFVMYKVLLVLGLPS